MLLLIGNIVTLSAQCLPDFGKASHFALFTVSGAVGNTGVSHIIGDVGSNIGAITGFDPPTILEGVIYTPGTFTSDASADLISAYNELMAYAPTNAVHAPAFGTGETLTEGVYTVAGAGSVNANLTLDAENNPDALFIFRFAGAFTTGAGTHVILINGANPENVFWVADGAVAMAANTNMTGTLIANNGAISIGDQGILHGRLYSTTGAVSTYGTFVNIVGVEDIVVGGTIPDQAICGGTLPADLILEQYSGTVVNWESASEPTFASPTTINVSADVLSGSTIGNLISTTYFRARVQNMGCITSEAFSSIATITVASTTWNGTGWSDGVPTSATGIVISGDFASTGDMTACTLTVINGAEVIMLSGDTVTLNGALSVCNDCSFTLRNDANLMQTSEVENIGVITVEKETAPLRRLDYILWSSPVEGQLLQPFSPLTLANRFYSYTPSSNTYSVIPSISGATFLAGSAYLIRMPNNHPTFPVSWDGSFTGVPSNGAVNLEVDNDTYNAVGNPYPSGIDANMFMEENNITGALYFWRKTNNANNSSYATYTTAGGVSNSGSDPLDLAPGEIIPIGQGFLVKSTSGSLFFNNSMRVISVGVPLLRNSVEKSRIWLNLTNADGFFGQSLIAYMPNATQGVDDAIDGRFFGDSPTALTSIIDNQQFSIQGRPTPFSNSDVVPLGFKSEQANAFTISINHFDGQFAGQDVFLKDNFTGNLANLKVSPYTFTTAAGIFNNRFELVYMVPLAATGNIFNPASVIIYKQGQNQVINTGSTIMATIKVYDLSGRLLLEKTNINASEIKIDCGTASQILLVNITSDQKETVTKKVIN